MTDIAALAAACTARIMDRIEMCRTARTAILSDDIKAEVERTLKEFLCATEKTTASAEDYGWIEIDVKHDERITLSRAELWNGKLSADCLRTWRIGHAD